MSSESELKRRMAVAVAIKIQAAVDEARRVAEEVERVTGHSVVSSPARSVLDMPCRDFVRQARLYAAVADVIDRWELPTSTRTVQSVLMVNREHAEMARLLKAAGHMRDDL